MSKFEGVENARALSPEFSKPQLTQSLGSLRRQRARPPEAGPFGRSGHCVAVHSQRTATILSGRKQGHGCSGRAASPHLLLWLQFRVSWCDMRAGELQVHRREIKSEFVPYAHFQKRVFLGGQEGRLCP